MARGVKTGGRGKGTPKTGGRRPGTPKTGGRKKGTPNRKTVEKREAEREAMALAVDQLSPQQIADMEPKDIMRFAMRYYFGQGAINLAHAAACDLAPYVHPRLAAMTLDATIDDAPLESLTDAQLEAFIRQSRRAERKTSKALH